MGYTPSVIGHDTLTVASSAVKTLAQGSAEAIPAGARSAVLQPSQNIRCWFDGTDPTTSAGFQIAAGVILSLDSRSEILGFRCIAESTEAVIAVSWYDMPGN